MWAWELAVQLLQVSGIRIVALRFKALFVVVQTLDLLFNII